MTVNEFALIKLRDSYEELDFLELTMQCQETQDAWCRQNQPCAVSGKPYPNLSTFCIQKNDPDYLLITAPWESVDAHREWIECSQNTSIFARLSEFIAPTCDSVLLFHMEPAGKKTELRGDLFAKEKFTTCRVSVEPSKRKDVEDKYQSIENEIEQLDASHRIWAGWRIESLGEIEDLVIFWNHSVPKDKLQPLLDMSKTKDIRTFQHIVPGGASR